MKKDKKLMLLVLTIIILIFTGCTSTSTGGKTYQECYYGADGEEVCVNKYSPEDPDVDQWYGW